MRHYKKFLISLSPVTLHLFLYALYIYLHYIVHTIILLYFHYKIIFNYLYIDVIALDVPRILSIACGPSASTFAFAAAASSSSHPHHLGASLTSSLTAPGLPSSRVSSNEMTSFNRTVTTGRGSSSSFRRGELPTAGGVYIWDLKTQRQKVD